MLTLSIAISVAALFLFACRLPVHEKYWCLLGIGFFIISSGVSTFLHACVDDPIQNADKLKLASHISIYIRHTLCVGLLISTGCFFVSFLKSKKTEHVSRRTLRPLLPRDFD
jgi:type IV secretory pathway TraG/TraD family ATPase VirD4